MPTMILENKNEQLSQKEFLNSFVQTLEKNYSLKRSEIEELTDIAAKNPVDKFVIFEKPDDFVAQGDLLIWSDITEQYKINFPRVTILEPAVSMALQDEDSITGDHELVTPKNAKFTLQKGKFIPPILEDHLWNSNSYDCKILEIDSPFIIKHREHGNFTFLTKGKYMICSSLDSESLSKMRD